MAGKPERRLGWIGRSPRPADATPDDAGGQDTPHLQAVPEALMAGELARIDRVAEERMEGVSEQLHETIDTRLGALESRLAARLDARDSSIEAASAELRAEADRLSRALEEAGEQVVERAGTLVFEQIRRADAAELERTRMARAALRGLGEEADRIRSESQAALDEQARTLATDQDRFQAEAARSLEELHEGRVSEALAALDARFDALEARVEANVGEQMDAIGASAEKEVEDLSLRAGAVVWARMELADSRLEHTVAALARQLDAMRATLRDAADAGAPAGPFDPDGIPVADPTVFAMPIPEPPPTGWRRFVAALRRR